MPRSITALLAVVAVATVSEAGAGRIQDVLPGKAAAPGATVLDLSGQACMPGWIDLHVHLGQESNPKSYEERFRLDDIALTSKVSFVMKDGAVYVGGSAQ